MIQTTSLFPEMEVNVDQTLFDSICTSIGQLARNAINEALVTVKNSEVAKAGVSFRNQSDCIHDVAFSFLAKSLRENGIEAVSYEDQLGNKKQFFEYKDIILYLRNADTTLRPSKVNKSIEKQSLSRPVISIEYQLSATRDEIARVEFIYNNGGTHFAQIVEATVVPEVKEQKIEEVQPKIKIAAIAKRKAN